MMRRVTSSATKQNRKTKVNNARFCSHLFQRGFRGAGAFSKLTLIFGLCFCFLFAGDPISSPFGIKFQAKKIFPTDARDEADRRDDKEKEEYQQDVGDEEAHHERQRHPTDVDVSQG